MYKNIFTIIMLATFSCLASTTIDPAHNDAYGANIGWVNASGDTVNGAVIGQAFCSDYLYSANCGWISLGDGSPANGQAYSNTSADDFGVNNDGYGNLTGYAYGANIGWINFEQTHGQPKVDLITGELSGFVWSANMGWINLDSGTYGVRTLSLAITDTDTDGISDAWEYGYTNDLTVLAAGGRDSDGDGVLDVDEYGADTDPLDPGDYLAITEFQTQESTNRVTWPVKTTRLYTLEHTTILSNGTSWVAEGTSFIPAAGPDVTKEVSGVTDTRRFYRVKVAPPLAP